MKTDINVTAENLIGKWVDGGGRIVMRDQTLYVLSAFGIGMDGNLHLAMDRDRAHGYGCEYIPMQIFVCEGRITDTRTSKPGQFDDIFVEPCAPWVCQNITGRRAAIIDGCVELV